MTSYAQVLAGLGSAIRRGLSDEDKRRWDFHAAVASVLGCDYGGCGACALAAEVERRQRYVAELAAIQRQHRESAARIAARTEADRARRARRLAREAALLERTAQIAPGAKCRVCGTSAGGSRSCRACGATGSPPKRGQERPRGRGQGSGAANRPRRSGGLSDGQRSLVDPYFDEIDHQLQIEEAATCLGD
jgi:hypothetical protein